MSDLDSKTLDIFLNGADDPWDSNSIQTLLNDANDFERYEEIELLATGGMKEIYKAFDRKNCRYVALAKLRRDVPEEQCEDFLREAYLTASLRHPNIISLYDLGVDKTGYPFFTMELKVGDSLNKIIRKRTSGDLKYTEKYNLNKCLEIFLKVCDAISYAHSNNILHLDIKPDNIQVGTFGEVQVCDWGLGCNTDQIASQSEDDMISGTPGFMAPEQIYRKSDIGPSTDIYALGAVLHTLLTGKAPFEGSDETILKKTIDGEILAQYDDDNIRTYESLDAVIHKAMSVEQNDRYQSVVELKNEVENFLSGRSTTAEEAGLLKEISLFYNRNKATCLIASISLTIFIFGSVFFILKLKKSNQDLKESNLKINEARKESDKNFQLYKEKVQSEIKLNSDLQKKTIDEIEMKLDAPIFFTNSIKRHDKIIDSLLKFYMEEKSFRNAQKVAKVLLISQRFSEVLKLKEIQEQPEFKIAEKFLYLKKQQSGVMNNNNFVIFLQELNKMPLNTRSEIMERATYYHLYQSNRMYSSPEIVKELVKCWNPGWDENQFEYHPQTLSLKVWGKNLKTLRSHGKFSSGLSVLRFVKIDSLIINDSSIDKLSIIGKHIFFTLDIRRTPIKDFKNIRKFEGLRKIIISKNQIPEVELKRVQHWVKIEIL